MNYWILQCNPTYFRLKDWLNDFNWINDPQLIDCWHISYFYKGEVNPNEDEAFIWQSKGDSNTCGIIATAKIVANPEHFPLQDLEPKYYKGNKLKQQKFKSTVAVQYVEILNKPLSKDEIEKHQELNNLTVLHNRHSICEVRQNEGHFIKLLIDRIKQN